MFKGKKILIVDDSPTEKHILRQFAEELEFDIYEAESGEESITKAMEIKPDVVLMDVVMPGLNGFQATREITKNEDLKNTVVIMCTTKNADTDKLWGKRQGASEYLVKPIQKESLINVIKKFI